MSNASSRRAFLRQMAAYSSLGVAAPLGLSLGAIGRAAAQSTGGDYRALVCIFLYGGNDAYNTVLTTDTDSWTHYQNHRNPALRNANDVSASLALMAAGTPVDAQASAVMPERLGGVLPIAHRQRGSNAGRSLALHPSLTDVQRLYGQGRVAVLSNVGPLQQPLTVAQYKSNAAPKPPKLFSHNDQQSAWQSFQPEGADFGWGGRMGDLLMSQNGLGMGVLMPSVQQSLTCMSVGSNGVWLTGNQTRQLQIGNVEVRGVGSIANTLGHAPLQAALAAVMGAGSSNHFAADYQAAVQRAMATEGLLNGALPGLGLSSGAPWSTAGFTSPWSDPKIKYTSPIDGKQGVNPLALQLQMVARLIEANRVGNIGIRRQVFMVSMGGFDNHDNQNRDHANQLAQLNHAIAYFDDVLGRMPAGDLRSQVTTFTASDFGRTLTNNGDGTDHGWGAHHFIMGGAVQGGDVYGRLPQLATADAQGHFDSPDLLDNGVMLPSTSVDQYAFTLGRWMGVSDANLRDILPNLSAFNSSDHNLGFMG